MNLNESYGITPFFLTIDNNGKEHIVTSISQLIAQNPIKFIYTGGNGVVRGMIVNEWQACGYDRKNDVTYRITISYTNPLKWVPSWVNSAGQLSTIPVQAILESINKDKKVDKAFYSITQYRPFLTRTEDYYVVINHFFVLNY